MLDPVIIFDSHLQVNETDNGKEALSTRYSRKYYTQEEVYNYYQKLKPVFEKLYNREVSIEEFVRLKKIIYLINK